MLRFVPLLALLPLSLGAQTATWAGPVPPAGGVGWAIVQLEPGDSLAALAVGDAALAYERAPGGWRALVPVPIAADGTVRLRLTVQGPARRPPAAVDLVIESRSYPTERLRVDPRFTETPTGALAERIARERQESAALIPVALQTMRLFDEPFRAPAPSAITSPFGTARVFNGEARSRHLGTDYEGATGDPVLAANRGVVMLIGDFYYSGRIVYVNHGLGLVTAYLHLSEVAVAVGDTLLPGQLVGRMGSSGRVTGPHLHWMVRVGSQLVDGTTLLLLPGPVEMAVPR